MHCQAAKRYTNTNQISRELFAELDEEIRERAKRLADKRAANIRRWSFGLIKPTESEVAAMRAEYAHAMYLSVLHSEAQRMRDILNAEDFE